VAEVWNLEAAGLCVDTPLFDAARRGARLVVVVALLCWNGLLLVFFFGDGGEMDMYSQYLGVFFFSFLPPHPPCVFCFMSTRGITQN
jgi:hypothetical protein